jgi:hypothetical protein
VSLLVLLAGPVAVAAAESPPAILSPLSGSASTSTPTFSGSAEAAAGPVTLRVYEGATVVREEEAPVSEEGAWSVLPTLLGEGTYTAAAFQHPGTPEQTESATITFTVGSPPVVTLGPKDRTVVAGETATFTAAASGFPEPEVRWQVSTNHGGSWTNTATTSGTLEVAKTTSAENGDEFRAVFSNSLGSTHTEAATLEVLTAPAITKQPSPVSATVGETVHFTAAASGNPAPEVQWEVSEDFGSTWSADLTDAGNTGDTLTVLPSLSQNGFEYRAKFTNVVSSATTSAATLLVSEPKVAPAVTTQPSNATVTEGEQAIFTASASGNPTPTVQWFVSVDGGKTFNADTTDTGNKTETLVVSGTTMGISGHQYEAVFTNVAGKATTAVATLKVLAKLAAPVVTTQPHSETVVSGHSASFTAAASGVPAPGVQWERSTNGGVSWEADTTDPGNTGGTLTISSASSAQNGYEYRAVFSNGVGEPATTAAATLTVDTAPVITEEPASASVVEGATAFFNAEASGFPTPTVKWEISTNGGASFTADTTDPGNTTDTLGVAATVAKSGNEYRATFTNAAGHATTAAATLTVGLKPTAPVVTAQPHSLTVVAGHPASFTAAASGVPVPGVQWERSTNGGSTWEADTTDPGNTSGTLTISSASFAENGYEYRAVFSNGVGEPAASAAAALTVDTVPVITEEPTSQSVIEGTPAVFTAEATGFPTPTVQWFVSTDGGKTFNADTTDTGNKTETLVVNGTTTAMSGRKYEAVFTNAAGKVTTAAATLTVGLKPTAPTVTTQPHALTVTEAEPASFTAAASGIPTPEVQWEVSTDGGAAWTPDTTDTGATTDTLTVTPTAGVVGFLQNGYEYRAVFHNASGTATSLAAALTVHFKPAVTVQPENKEAHTGETATFTAAAAGNPAPTVQWQVSTNAGVTWASDSDPGSKTGTLEVSAALSKTGDEYRAVFSNGIGEAAPSHAATLTVTQAPLVTKNPVPMTVTETGPATFTATASGLPAPEVQWEVSTDGGATWAADTTDAGATTGTLTVTPTAGETGFVQNGYQYRAFFHNTLGSTTTSAATLTVHWKPAVTLQPTSLSAVAGETPEFVAAASSNPAATVQWEVSTDGGKTFSPDAGDEGNTSGTLKVHALLAKTGFEYRAVFSNGVGVPATSEAATLTVSPKPEAPAVKGQPHALTVTAGQPASFTATASGSPTPKVQWQVSTDGGASWTADTTDSGAATDTLTLSSATPADNGNQYRAVFSNGVGEPATSEPATLTVDSAPGVTVAPVSQSVIAGQSATFTAAATGVPAPSVTWQRSTDGGATWTADTTDAGAGTDSLLVASATVADNGYKYRAVFTNVVGTVETAAATLTVSPVGAPVASFTWFPTHPHVGETVSLVSTATDADSPIATFAWNTTGAGALVPGPSVMKMTFSTAGSHAVSLGVTDERGLTASVTQTIVVEPRVLPLIQPFPVVRIAGFDTAVGARLTLLSVLAPAGARITITCKGSGCPSHLRANQFALTYHHEALALLKFKRFERAFHAPAALEIRVSARGEIGKYTRFTIRRGKLPVRVDACLDPTTSKPMSCPVP